jgi:tetratricopeptide (TPR) repeat protein
MGSDQVRKFAEGAGHNSDDLPLLEFHAPRQLFRETRILNVTLLYENKDGLVPEGAELGDRERAYSSMIEPFLDMERTNLANQALGMLSQAAPPGAASVHLAIAQIAYDRGELEGADAELQLARDSAAPDAPIVANIEEMRGLIREKFGDSEGAIEHYKASVEVEPQRLLPLKRISELYGIRKDYVNGAQWMEKYVAAEPLSLGHQYGILGDYYFAAEDVPNGTRALRKGVEVDPYTFWVRYRLAQILEEQKDSKGAIEQYEIALRYGFDREPEIYNRLSALYKSMGRSADAARLIRTGLRLFPTNSELYRLYRESGSRN